MASMVGFIFCRLSNQATVQRGARRDHCGIYSEISLYMLRSHCTKFGALDYRITIKTKTDYTTESL